MLQNYANARADVEKLTERLKEAQERKNQHERTLIDALTSKEATSTAKYEGLGCLTLTKPKVKASCRKEFEEDLFTFLRDNGYEDLIKESVHHSSLSSFVGGQLEDGIDLPEFITYYLHQGVMFRSN